MGLTLFLLGVFVICMAMLWTEGLWGNILSFINVLFAAILATNFYAPVAQALDNAMPSFTYFWDFLCLWGLFAISYAILRLITDKLSKWRVRFLKPVENAGNICFAVLVALEMVCFTSFTLHTAPLPRAPFGGAAMSDPSQLNVKPGLLWASFASFTSNGSLSDPWPPGFNGQTFLNYNTNRRTSLEEAEELRVSR